MTLPAATSEKIEVPLLAYDLDPSGLTWQGAVSLTANTWPGPAPASFSAATAVNRGTSADPDWRVQIQVDSLLAGTYGVWLKVNGGVGGSPVRYAGRLILV
jgi:hypothetical protein